MGLSIGHYTSNNFSGDNFYGVMNNSDAQPIGIRFYFSSGNFERADVNIYGIKGLTMYKFVVDLSKKNPAKREPLTAEETQARQSEEATDGTDAERAMKTLRTERNRRLAETDWSQGADVPDAIKNAYTSYRQALRDITNTYNNPRTVVWPDKP